MPPGPAPADPGRDDSRPGTPPEPGSGRRGWTITAGKAQVIAAVTVNLDPGEARRAEAMVLGRAGRLTPGGLRAAIARAVIDVAPRKPASGGRRRRGTRGCSSGPRTPATPR